MGLIEAADATVTKPCWRLYKTATGAAGEDGGRADGSRRTGSKIVGIGEGGLFGERLSRSVDSSALGETGICLREEDCYAGLEWCWSILCTMNTTALLTTILCMERMDAC